MNRVDLHSTSTAIRLRGGADPSRAGLHLDRTWDGPLCRSALVNDGSAAVHVDEVVLFAGPHDLSPDTPFYGEGFQMLSQTAGTLGTAANLSKYSDHGHYKFPQPPGSLTVYNLALLRPESDRWLLLAFTGCRRFVGSLHFWPDRFEIVLDTEGLSLQPGERWELEEFYRDSGPDRDALFAALAAAIQQNHPRLEWRRREIPTGWCSWYFYGPRVTEDDILANLAAISAHNVDLRYIQIDDGFQSRMGDWLIPGDRFPSGLPTLCRRIRDEGFEPAIWLAPFSAERDSALLRDHPDWFIQAAGGTPLLSSEVSFGGWRCGPWYMLDGTHPGAQDYLEEVCRTIRHEWGVRYFKLDALTWGCLPLGSRGRRYEPTATRVQAYRQGLAAIRRGAGVAAPHGGDRGAAGVRRGHDTGEDSFILGCNAPMWPSLGEVHGMRTSNDVSRTWSQISLVARETFWRTWQHGRLWVIDPDCVLLANADRGRGPSTVTDDEFAFHAAAILASGGMVLSGDDVTALSDDQWSILQKLVSPSGTAASFEDTSWETARIDRPDGPLLCLFNWDDTPAERTIPSASPAHLVDYWTGEPLRGQPTTLTLPPHSARVLRPKTESAA